ncbi:putative bifunctional diguanylate cyclase/phosphodiesterase [Nocardioides sp. Kera G14]|uniref:putative bifunctional diguanylate cyclase/phosphodiesterase n=1 Tax=Nocardioides sp. Kera G14 TaxID=2884264 RepID=UPI001D103F71|nr:bifunctional diguanylate cyclase/phosphodiesterase [Nocardioides sp. Kera G14]UDY24773.1 bifunctional diguanylate cyclase/phosphodiesterase [Nocardioides sp. Kera G14]
MAASLGGTSAGSYRHAPAVAPRKILSRAAGVFYLLGGIACQLPPGDIRLSAGRNLTIHAIGYFELVIGLALLLTGHRWPRWTYHPLVAGGSILIAATIMLARGSATAEDPLITFALPMIAGTAFFSWRGAVVHGLIVDIAAFVAMTYIDLYASRIIIVLGGLACIGASVGWLARVGDRIEEDPLTGLGNRRALARRLEFAVESAARGNDGLAVVMLDLDHFKAANDRGGHAAGDELLVSCTRRWREVVPHERLLFRYGGDEFVLLLPGCSLGEATELADELRAGLPQEATASIGVAMWERGDSSSLLMGRADVALYDAKANGRNQTVAYGDPSQAAREIEMALKAGEFVLHYQPIVALEDGTVRGAEALVRWQHPKRGLLGPSEFISHAERTGSIHALGAWTLDRAVAAAAAAGTTMVASVNVSITELRNPAFSKLVSATIERHHLTPRRLIVEVTEGVYDEHDQQVITSLTEIRALGVRVALDDFGSGWSSLRWLTSFPIDVIKIDGSFVHGIDSGATSFEVLNAIIRLGKALGLSIVGEQVETERQAAVLCELGCDRAQGYYFGRPAPDLPASGLPRPA